MTPLLTAVLALIGEPSRPTVDDEIQITPPGSVVRCGCGRMWNLEAWLKLHSPGVQHCDGFDLELHDCPCGNTMARRVR